MFFLNFMEAKFLAGTVGKEDIEKTVVPSLSSYAIK